MRPMRCECATSGLLRAVRLAGSLRHSVQGEGARTLIVPDVLSVLVVQVQRRAHLSLELLPNLVLSNSLFSLRLLSIASSLGINRYGGWRLRENSWLLSTSVQRESIRYVHSRRIDLLKRHLLLFKFHHVRRVAHRSSSHGIVFLGASDVSSLLLSIGLA